MPYVSSASPQKSSNVIANRDHTAATKAVDVWSHIYSKDFKNSRISELNERVVV